MDKLIKAIRHFLHEAVSILAPKWLKRRMISCQQVTEILSSERHVSSFKKVQLHMHMMICQCCTNYKAQLKFINQKAKNIQPPKFSAEQQVKIDNSKEDLINKFSNNK